MGNKKFITTTLPYLSGEAHMGHALEFLLADLIAEYYRHKLGKENVFLNVGVDEHGQAIYQKAEKDGFVSTQEYCNKYADIWKDFCVEFNIGYDNFYRTTSQEHKDGVLKFYSLIKKDLYKKNYSGKYCNNCESFITDKEIDYPNNCPSHKIPLIQIEEENVFFKLHKYSSLIKDTLIDKSLSNELANIINEDYDLSITRKNVSWGVKNEEGETFYVWAEALLCYILSIKYFDDPEYFESFWSDSLQICGKDNLKFQSYIFPALLLAANTPQSKEVLVHGMILDENSNKMSKSLGNIINPKIQKEKFGLLPLKYYLVFGLNTFKNSKYVEKNLIELWNADVANGLGNTIARTLHLVDVKQVDLNPYLLSPHFLDVLDEQRTNIDNLFSKYEFQNARLALVAIIKEINERINNEKPFEKTCAEPDRILREIYFQLKNVLPFYQIIFKEKSEELAKAFTENKKVILFERLKTEIK